MPGKHRTGQGRRAAGSRPSSPATAVWLRRLVPLLETRPCSGSHRSLRDVSRTHRGLGHPGRQRLAPRGPLPGPGFLPSRGHGLRPRPRMGMSACGVFSGPSPLHRRAPHERGSPSSRTGDSERSLPFSSPPGLRGRKGGALSITSYPRKAQGESKEQSPVRSVGRLRGRVGAHSVQARGV